MYDLCFFSGPARGHEGIGFEPDRDGNPGPDQ